MKNREDSTGKPEDGEQIIRFDWSIVDVGGKIKG